MNSDKNYDGKKRRNIWDPEEDESLFEIVKKKGKKNWNEIAKLHNKANNTQKTGKQCRERYRNYVNQNFKSCKWSQEEKVAFILLHKLFGNQWSHIAKYLVQRNDITIKNYFYSLIRKAIRQFKKKSVLPQMLRLPEKLFKIYSMIELIRTKYLPALIGGQTQHKNENAEKIILDLLKDSGATFETLLDFQKNLIQKFKDFHSTDQFPIILKVDFFAAGIPHDKANELREFEKLLNQNEGLIKGIVNLQFGYPTNKQEEEDKTSKQNISPVSQVFSKTIYPQRPIFPYYRLPYYPAPFPGPYPISFPFQLYQNQTYFAENAEQFNPEIKMKKFEN